MKRVYGTEGTGPGGKGRSSVLLGDDCADRVQWVSNEFAARGKSFSVTDGYRPDGVEADYWVDNPSKTSTGGFNQWYAIGQHRRRGAAYAAPVGGSDHAKTRPGEGAIDCSVQDMALRHELMGVVGMIQTDPTETWHFAVRRNPATWWNRAAVTYPGQTVTPTKPAPPTNSLKEAIRMFLVTQSSTPVPGQHKRTFIMTSDRGAVHLTDPAQVSAWLNIFAQLGLKGPGFEKSIELPWDVITHASEGVQGKNAKA